MMIWFLIVISVNSNSTVNAEIEYPNSYQYNSEADCKRNGQKNADEYQMKFGTNNSKVFWKCQAIPLKDIAKILPPNV